MSSEEKITGLFGVNLAKILSNKIQEAEPAFNTKQYIKAIEKQAAGKTLTQRVELHADELNRYLPGDYEYNINKLIEILGPENPKETGMFTNFYWVMPISKYVEKYGLEHYDTSIKAIAEITKRNTGEYAIRPYVRKYPRGTVKQMKTWARSDNFHLRRLASEGLRPKLPWASKLDLFIDKPKPVFEILEMLKADPIKFVQKSVANHLTDYIKVNPAAVKTLMQQWQKSENESTKWILKHATRKYPIFTKE